jgi:hypothetical protein
MEELHSELGMIANLSTLEMRASATAKVAAEGIKHVEIDIPQNTALLLDEAAEMGCGANVSKRAGRRISGTFEAVCE